MTKEKKKETEDDMAFDEGRCVIHEKDILYNKESLAKIKKFLFDDNGEKGISMRIHDVESTLEVFKERERRKQQKYDRLSVALIIQAVAFLILILKDYFLK